ncbi:MAG: 2-hydroxyacid dehydrogenase [Pseudomonadota bacterium]
MTEDVLVICPLLKSCMTALERDYRVHRYWQTEDKAALLAQIGPNLRAVATDGHHGVPADVMAAAPQLGVVASLGVGYDGIDIDACRARGIQVGYTPDVLNDAVAELTLGMMLALSRRIVEADRYVRAGRWVAEGAHPFASELTGRTAGIVGLGRIGKEIAVRCQAMKMQVVYHGRSEQTHQPYPYFADLTEMARESDWLILIAPGGAGTRHIVNRQVLEALGPEGRLLNVARGSLVDEPVLVEMLQTGGIAGAALDVFEAEPSVPEALFGLDNVVLSPHQGSATDKTRYDMGDLVVRNLAAYFAGRPLVTPVP